MKNYRMGNTLTIKWTLTQPDGTAYVLSAGKVELFASTPNHRFEIAGFTVSGNVVTWRFDGDQQKFPGPYTLTLVENRGEVDMVTVDFCDAFGLVKYSCLAGGTDTPGVTTEAVDLSSEVSMSQIGLSPEVEKVIADSVSDYGLFAVALDMTTGELSMTKGEKTDFSGGELNEKGELKIMYNY